MVLDVEVTTGQANEGDHVLPQVDMAAATTGAPVRAVTADQGCVYGKLDEARAGADRLDRGIVRLRRHFDAEQRVPAGASRIGYRERG